MITLKMKTTISLLLLGFVVGCCVAMLLFSGCNNTVAKEHSVAIAALKKETREQKAAYEAKLAGLEQDNHALQTQLEQVRAKLQEAKTKTSGKKAVIKRMIQPVGFPARDLLDSDNLPASASEVSDCDSLKIVVGEFITESEIKDSLYESHIAVQDEIITGKDAVIAVQKGHISDVSEKLGQSLQQQTELVALNTRLQKKLHRQKTKGRLFAFATAILSGVATHYLTK